MGILKGVCIACGENFCMIESYEYDENQQYPFVAFNSADYISHASCTIDCICVINPIYSSAKCIIELLSWSEPITGLIQFSLFNITEMETINLLSDVASIIPDSVIKIFH